MATRQMSWTMAALLFAAMLVGTISLDIAFSSSLRHQFLSLHSDFWRIAIPADMVADAILVVAMRAAYNWLRTCRNRADLKTNPAPR